MFYYLSKFSGCLKIYVKKLSFFSVVKNIELAKLNI